jgi:hypothetical protein
MVIDRSSMVAIAIPANPRFEDLRGRVFDRLTPIEFLGIEKKHPIWRCICNCGNITVARSLALKQGRMKSCGCYQSEIRGAAQRVHGDAHYPGGAVKQSREYTAWLNIKDRCMNPDNESYGDYGGRGICVAARWLDGENGLSGYQCFLADMGRKPNPGLWIDRYPNNNGNYEPGNCRWATPSQQQRNRRDTVMVRLVDGRGVALADACDFLKLDYRLVRNRMQRGWTFDRAACEPKHWRGCQ